MKITTGRLLGGLVLGLTLNKAQALAGPFDLVTRDVINGYSDCQMVDNGNGTSTASVTVSFKEIAGRLGNGVFYNRGLLLFAYNAAGAPVNKIRATASLGGDKTSAFREGNHFFVMGSNSGTWLTKTPFTTIARVTFDNSMLSEWPAVSIQAANVTSGNTVAEVTGGAYISVGASGSCKVVKYPGNPPLKDSLLTVTTPDWNLGEIKSGARDIAFSASADQFCISQFYPDTNERNYIINADSQNGVVGNQYQLKKIGDASAAIPYTLTLTDSLNGRAIHLPNQTLTSSLLNKGGKTCFLPTFHTRNDNVPPGDYSDVLTFTIVTKS